MATTPTRRTGARRIDAAVSHRAPYVQSCPSATQTGRGSNGRWSCMPLGHRPAASPAVRPHFHPARGAPARHALIDLVHGSARSVWRIVPGRPCVPMSFGQGRRAGARSSSACTRRRFVVRRARVRPEAALLVSRFIDFPLHVTRGSHARSRLRRGV